MKQKRVPAPRHQHSSHGLSLRRWLTTGPKRSYPARISQTQMFSGTERSSAVTKQRTCKVEGVNAAISEPGFCSVQRSSVLIHGAHGDVGFILLGSLEDHGTGISMGNLTFSHSFG